MGDRFEQHHAANVGQPWPDRSHPVRSRSRSASAVFGPRRLIAVAIAARVVELGISASLASTISDSITQAPEFNGDLETFPTLVLTGAVSGGALQLIHLHDLKILPGWYQSTEAPLGCLRSCVCRTNCSKRASKAR